MSRLVTTMAVAMLAAGIVDRSRSTLPPKPTPTPEEIERQRRIDFERWSDARAKKRRKLERFTNTPEARKRRAEAELAFAAGDPVPHPPPYDPAE